MPGFVRRTTRLPLSVRVGQDIGDKTVFRTAECRFEPGFHGGHFKTRLRIRVRITYNPTIRLFYSDIYFYIRSCTPTAVPVGRAVKLRYICSGRNKTGGSCVSLLLFTARA